MWWLQRRTTALRCSPSWMQSSACSYVAAMRASRASTVSPDCICSRIAAELVVFECWRPKQPQEGQQREWAKCALSNCDRGAILSSAVNSGNSRGVLIREGGTNCAAVARRAGTVGWRWGAQHCLWRTCKCASTSANSSLTAAKPGIATFEYRESAAFNMCRE